MELRLKKLLTPDRLTCRDCKDALRKKAPYCLYADGRTGKLLVLDRDYKPLGSDGRHADYNDPKWADRLFDPSELHLDVGGLTKQGENFWFYNDDNSPHFGNKRDRDRYVALLEAVFPPELLDRVAHLSATASWK